MKQTTNTWVALVFGLTCSLFSHTSTAEIAVIVHPSNSAELDAKAVKKLFLGKSKSFPNGEHATLYIHGGDSGKEFNKKVLKKSSSQFKAYWSKLAFSGKATPPKKVGSDEEAKKVVSTDTEAIAYIDAGAVDDTIKVLFTM